MKITLAILLFCMITACTMPEQSLQKTITIGAILPLTGDGASWGAQARYGIEEAITDINRNGAINGTALAVIFEDGTCDPTQATTAAQKLIASEHVPAIIGEVCSGATLAIAHVTEPQHVILMNPCSGSSSISTAGDFVFRTWIPNNYQARALGRYATQHVTRIALLQIDNDYGKTLANSFKENFAGEILMHETYTDTDHDFRTQLVKIKATHPDALILISYAADAALAIKQIHELGIDSPILMTNGANSPDFFQSLGPLSDGIIMTEINDQTNPEFVKHYENKTGNRWTIGQCAAAAYDSTQLVFAALQTARTNPNDMQHYLAAIHDFPGVSTNITFDKNGDLQGEYGLYAVKNQTLEKI